MEIKLEDILATEPSFKINNKTYDLRLFTLKDQVWMKEKFGTSEALTDAIMKTDWSKIIPLIYHLMKDKSDFKAETRKEINDEGIEVETFVSGPDRLAESLSSIEDQLGLISALNASFTKSSPMAKKLVSEDLKKKGLVTGVKSSISSPRNTDGRRKRSQASR